MVLLIGIVIGLVLGLTGAGGSVFAVPLLILVLSLPVNDAIGIALGAVAISALYGTLNNWRYKSILWIPAIILGTTGVLFAPVGKLIGNQLSPTLLLFCFNCLAIVIALRMWRQASKHPEQANVIRSGHMTPESFVGPVCRMSTTGQFEWRPRCVGSLVIGGLVVGLLTGLFGVGGGFLIVPLLLFLSQVSTQQAAGTSLLIITVVATSGFISFTATAPHVDWPLLFLIAVGGVVGMFVGRKVGYKIASAQLQKIFSISLITIALITLVNQWLSSSV